MGVSTEDQNNGSGSYFWKDDQRLQGPGSRGRASQGWGPRLLELLYRGAGKTTVGQKCIQIVILALITLLLIFMKVPPSRFMGQEEKAGDSTVQITRLLSNQGKGREMGMRGLGP